MLTGNFNLILYFSEIPKIIICFPVSQQAFYLKTEKKLSVWSTVLFMTSALEIREKEAYR